MHGWLSSPKTYILTPLLLALVFVLACGGADATAVPPAATSTSQQQAQPTSAPQAAAAQAAAPQATASASATTAPSSAGQVTAPTKAAAPQLVVTPTPQAAAVQPAVSLGKYGGVVNMQQYAGVRQRQIYQSSITVMNQAPVMSMLVMYDPTTPDQTDITCDLCASWELADDGVTYTFRMNPDGKWHDGTPVTARDVVFSFDAMVNPDQFEILKGRSTSSTVNAGLYYEAGNAREIDTLTAEVVTMFPSAAFIAAIAVETSPVMSYKAVMEDGIVQGIMDFGGLIGSGPFNFVEEVKDVSVTYERWDDYWKPGLPYLDGMKHFIITDPGRAIAAYKTGQILTTNWISNLTPKEARKLDDEMDNLSVHWGGPTGGLHIHMNTTKAPFDQWQVRQAVQLAIHRQPIIETTSGGSDAMGYGLPEGFWFSNSADEYANMVGFRESSPGVKDQRDIDAALAYLVEAGIPEGSGVKFKITARNCCGYPDQAVQVKEQLKDTFGWDITLRVMEASAGFDAYWAGDTDMFVQASALNYMDPDGLFSNKVRGTVPQWIGGGRGKFFAVDGVEDLFYAQQIEQDLEERIRMTHEMDTLLQNNGNGTVNIYWTMRDHPVEHRIQNFNFDWNNKKWEHVWCDPMC